MSLKYGVIIHGGAWDIPKEAIDDHKKGVFKACQLAKKLLENDEKSIDIVEKVINLLEDDPTFDAGTGSFLTKCGKVEMDALIATDDFKIGSVCALKNIKHPISVARLVRDKTKHVLLTSEGANELARELGVKECKTEELLVGRELERYLYIKNNEKKNKKEYIPKTAFGKYQKPKKMGTVGIVCLDKFGKLAIGVSTGGSPYKHKGRVGDSPLWGCGGYCEKIGGSVATGFGEDLIRVLITRQVVDYMNQGLNAQQASEKAIKDLKKKVNGLGGVITLSKTKGFGFDFNTPKMAFAHYVVHKEETKQNDIVVGIYESDKSKLTHSKL